MRGTRRWIDACLALSILAISAVYALGYDLSWYTVDDGCAASSGGDFELTGTAGQPDAGAALAGGDFELTGGFWMATTSVVSPPTCGDLEGDGGKVDMTDFSQFAACFGLRAPNAYCPPREFDLADLDQNGRIDMTDFQTFAALFGTVSTNTPPNCP